MGVRERTLLRMRTLPAKVGASRASIWNWVKAGTFPAPIRLSPGAVAWVSDDVEKWIDDRIAASRKAAKGESSVAANDEAFSSKTALGARTDDIQKS